MNALMLLKPKSEVEYLIDTYTVRQGLEVIRAHSYAAIPVITKEGLYVGSVSEGDFLWHMVDNPAYGSIRAYETESIHSIIRPEWIPAVSVNVSMDTLIERSANQNFIPVTDDRGYFIGIITRKTIIQTFCSSENAKTSVNLRKIV